MVTFNRNSRVYLNKNKVQPNIYQIYNEPLITPESDPYTDNTQTYALQFATTNDPTTLDNMGRPISYFAPPFETIQECVVVDSGSGSGSESDFGIFSEKSQTQTSYIFNTLTESWEMV